MGPELANQEMDRIPNGDALKSNGNSREIGHDHPNTLGNSRDGKHREDDGFISENSVVDNQNEKQNILGVKSTNFDTDLVDNKIEKPGAQKRSDDKSSPLTAAKSGGAKGTLRHHTVPQSFSLAAEKRAGVTCSVNVNDTNSPVSKKNSQMNSPLSATRRVTPDNKKPLDDEDNWSLASSIAASVQTVKSVTYGSAPSFRSAERAEKRREFYSKLEEKHRALEAEKNQAEARTKEEQQAAIRQLRRSMVVKANPVPSFYYEPPPPKVEPKKLPLTRPVSPKFNRRKSCSDAIQTKEEAVKHFPKHRHSMGSHKVDSKSPVVSKTKPQSSPQTANGTRKLKERSKPVNATAKASPDEIKAAISVES